MADTYNYLKSSYVYVYPSSNATDGGENNSEFNVESLNSANHYGKNYIVRKYGTANTFNYIEVNRSLFKLIFHPLTVCIEGYRIDLKDPTTESGDILLDVPSRTVSNNKKYYIYLALHKDGAGNVKGDQVNIISGVEELDCNGVSIRYSENLYNMSDYPNMILLGYYMCTSRLGPTIVIPDPSSTKTEDKLILDNYSIIDINQIGNPNNDIDVNSALIRTLSQYYIQNKTLSTLLGNTTQQEIGTPLRVYDNVLIRGTGSNNGKVLTVTGYIGVQTPENNSSASNTIQIEGDRIDINNAYIVGGNNNSININGLTGIIEADDLIIRNNIVADGTVTASKVYNAVWNDYADAVKKDENLLNYEYGDIISKKPNSNSYTLCNKENCHLVVGVCSNSYGHLLGGDEDKSLEENLINYIPIAVAGNVRVKVKGVIKEGDLITSSDIDGVGEKVVNYIPGTVIGKALENKDDESIGKILMQVMLC